MSWSSAQQKNYLHLAAERGLASSLKLLLESARWEAPLSDSSSRAIYGQEAGAPEQPDGGC